MDFLNLYRSEKLTTPQTYPNPSLLSRPLRSPVRVACTPDDVATFQLRSSTQARRALSMIPIPSPYSYHGKGVDVIYLRDHRRANDELAGLFETNHASESRSKSVAGFDIEWNPNVRHADNAIALVQIATLERVLLIHLSAMTIFPKKLVEFLEDKSIIKAGVGILCDARRVYKDFDINIRSCIELSYLARALDGEQWPGRPADLIALTRLVRVYTGRELAKGGKLQMSDWERELTPEQIEYAANDAYASVSVAAMLLERAVGRDTRLWVDPSRFMFDVVHAKAVCVDSLLYPRRLLFPSTVEKIRKTTRLRPRESSSELEPLRDSQLEERTPSSSHTAGKGGHAILRDREMEVWEMCIPESTQKKGDSGHPVSTGWRWFFSLLWK